MISSTDDLLKAWFRRLRESQFSHYEAARSLEGYNYWLGLPAVLFSTFVGTSVFATLGKAVDPRLQILVGLTSVVAALLSGVQTFLRFSERADKHRSIAARYGAVRRRIEEIFALGGEISKEDLAALREQIDRLAEDAPNISSRVWAKSQRMMGQSRLMPMVKDVA